MCAIRIKTMFFNMWVINIHAPTEDKDEETKKEFYLKLERLYDSLPTNDIKMVIGDMNAKIAKENIYKGTIGSHSLHQVSNENGQRLIGFATSRNLVISSTWFPHKDIHKATWRSPDGRTTNQIVLIERIFASNILDVRSFRGADCGTDHYLVKTKIRCKINKNRKETREPTRKYDITKLREDPKIPAEIRESFNQRLDCERREEKTLEDIDKKWQWIKDHPRSSERKPGDGNQAEKVGLTRSARQP